MSAVALFVFGVLGCTGVYFLFVAPDTSETSAPAPAIAAQPPTAPEPTPSSTPVPQPSATTTPSETPEPTPTGTKVVIETVQPTPTPTVANCISTIQGFGGSGVITDEEAEQYLRNTIPLSHLENCRGIEYVPKVGKVDGTHISGNIVPAYRQIYVYSLGEFQSKEILLDTLIHEIGHNVHYNIRRNQLELDTQWSAIYRQSTTDGFVSDYAQTDKFEDFAETYLAYVRYPELLNSINFAKYEYMRLEIFNGQEYGQ